MRAPRARQVQQSPTIDPAEFDRVYSGTPSEWTRNTMLKPTFILILE